MASEGEAEGEGSPGVPQSLSWEGTKRANMKLLPALRRSAFLIVVAALVAGCATPQESGPENRLCDADGDGLPDGDSPIENANESCPDTNAPLANETPSDNDNQTPTMPGVAPG